MQKQIMFTRSLNTLAEETIGLLDEIIRGQLNTILHHRMFQALESAWRGLQLLTQSIEKTQRVKIRYLVVNMKDLAKDLTSVAEFEQSHIFKKIYADELDQAGGEPFGLLLGDYYVDHQVQQGVDGIEMLRQMAQVCAAAFVPFVTSVSAQFFELDRFSELKPTLNLPRLLASDNYHRWHRLRREENSHFIGLTLPRILMRTPYNTDGVRLAQRSFTETLQNHDDYLWGNACYAYASSVIKSYEQTGWFMALRADNTQKSMSSILATPRAHYLSSANITSQKISTECLITDSEEKILNGLGFMSLRDHRLTQQSVFYTNQSIKLAKRAANDLDYTQGRINTMLNYVLCACRFAHYIKIIIRNKVGSFISVEDCETFITRWLSQYCSSAKGQSLQAIMKNPLTAADVNVKEIMGSPGKYFCAMSISPHSQFDDIQSQLKLVTNIRLQ